MKHTIPTLALLAVASAAYAQSDPVKAAEKQIEAQYQTNVIDAYRRHDLDRFAKAFTADVTIKGVDGKTANLKQHLARAKQEMADTVTIRSARAQFHASTLKGDTLVSDASEVWDSDIRDTQGLYGPRGKTYATIWRCRATYVHVKTADGWRLKRAEIKSETLTSGGKPLVPLKK